MHNRPAVAEREAEHGVAPVADHSFAELEADCSQIEVVALVLDKPEPLAVLARIGFAQEQLVVGLIGNRRFVASPPLGHLDHLGCGYLAFACYRFDQSPLPLSNGLGHFGLSTYGFAIYLRGKPANLYAGTNQ